MIFLYILWNRIDENFINENNDLIIKKNTNSFIPEINVVIFNMAAYSVLELECLAVVRVKLVIVYLCRMTFTLHTELGVVVVLC